MTAPTLLHEHGLFPPWIRWGFTTRHAGVSTGPYDSFNLGWDVGDDSVSGHENNRRLGETPDYDAEMMATVRQVHGHRVHVVHRAPDGRTLRGQQGDAIVLSPQPAVGGRGPAETDRGVGDANSGPESENREPRTENAPTAPLAAMSALVRVADCCPVIIAALERRAAAVLHCGWRSTVRGLVARTVGLLIREIAEPQPALAAAIGPCIGPAAFEVGEEVAAAFAEKVSLDVVLRRPGRRKPHIDLQAAVRLLLIRAGIPGDRIVTFRRCTASEPGDFFSFRRDGHDSGRQSGVVALFP